MAWAKEAQGVLVFLGTVLHIVLSIVFCVRILIRENISGPARLAWFIVIVTLPIFGTLVYLLTGETNLRLSLRNRHGTVMERLRREVPEAFEGPAASLSGIPCPRRKVFHYGKSINGFAAVSGNSAELMPDDATHQARLVADIDAAEVSVNHFAYIWLDDQNGREIAEALIRAAKRGVTCRAGVDHLGARRFVKTQTWRRMGEAGVECQIAMPLESWFGVSIITRADLRNHRKVSVIDGRIAWLGSRNTADPAFLPKARHGPWIDVALRVEGPVTNQVQALFASDWMLFSDAKPRDFQFDGVAQSGGFTAQFRGTGPLERHLSSSQMFCTLFEMAERQLLVTTPYFVPDVPVDNALRSAALRGVDVRLILPRSNDSWLVKSASQGFYDGLLEAGVKIFEHGPGLLHSKIATIDEEMVLLGSSNLDLRSFDLNFENDLLLHDAALARAIAERQAQYLAQSQKVTLESIRARPLLTRLRDNVMATMGPVL